jgi:glycosyltransferase involved in cell wall biosynthesis
VVARVTAVVPALNEAANLVHVLPLVPCCVDELILVDGESTDGTVEVARMLRPDVVVVRQPAKGKGAALRAGFRVATGDIIVALDADGSTDPREIPAFVAALHEGADYAKGSRFVNGGGTTDMSLLRKCGNWGFVLLVRLLFRYSFSDLCYGYNAFWVSALPQMRLDCDGFEIETLMTLRAVKAQLRIVEIPSFEHPRATGVSHLHACRDGWRVLKTILRERFVLVRTNPISTVLESGLEEAVPITDSTGFAPATPEFDFRAPRVGTGHVPLRSRIKDYVWIRSRRFGGPPRSTRGTFDEIALEPRTTSSSAVAGRSDHDGTGD